MAYECELLYPNNGTVYVYGINLISARNSDGDDTFYLYNAHGDVVQLVDGSGTITQTYNYDAFGVEYDVGEDDENYFRYAGQYFDTETGTYYLRARYYNPANGRFTQQDGWEFGNVNDPLSLNLYTYCANNPVMRVDPTGNAWWHWAVAAAIVAVAAVAVVATAGGAAAAVTAVLLVSNGIAAGSTAATVAAGAFIGSAAVLGTAALAATAESKSLDDFADQGNMGTVAATAFGAVAGAVMGYVLESQTQKQVNSQASTQSNTQSNNQSTSANVKIDSPNNTTNAVTPNGKAFDANQSAVIDLAKEVDRKGVSMDEAKILVDYAKEYNISPARIDMGHITRGNPVTQGPHAHIGPINHIGMLSCK